MLHSFFQKTKEYVVRYDAWFLTLLAFLVRMVGLGWMGYANFPEFYRDYGMTSRIITGQLVWLGPPSMLGGFHFPPFYYYSMAPLLWLLHGHPVGLLLTGVVFGALSVFVFYHLLLLWTGERSVARVGALLCALSVYSVHLSSYTSNPNFLPVFVLWFFYHLTQVLQGSARTSDYVWLGISFSLATQLHTTALIVLPLVAIGAVLLLRPKLFFGKLAQAGAVAFALYVPYFVYDALHGFANFARLFVLGAHNLQGGNAAFSARALWNFFFGTLTPFNYWYTYTNIEPNSLNGVIAVVFTVVLVLLLRNVFVRKFVAPYPKRPLYSREGKVIAWLWLAVSAVVLLLYSRAAHDHYLIVLWPVPLIALVWAVWWLRLRFGVFRSMVFALVVVSALQIVSFYGHGREPWKDFFSLYTARYKNDPNISEIGATW